MKKNVRTHSKKKQALALLEEHRLTEARDLFAEVCKIDPLDAEAWFRLGTTNIELSAMKQAEGCFRRVVELQPRLVIAYYNLGRSIELQGRGDEAVAVYQKLLQIAPHSEAYFNIATIYTHQGKFPEALEAFRQAQRIEPNNPRLIAGEAGVYEKQGDYEAAYARIQPLLEAGEATPDIAMVLAPLSQYIDCRSQAIELLEKLLARRDLAGNRDVLIPLHFELGRLLDAAGDYDGAFTHFRQGNDLIRTSFDLARYTRFVDEVIATFSKDFMRSAPRARDSADHLIFIVGMPRSGTTLIEQILDSHPQVYGCGELQDIGFMANRLPDAQGDEHTYPRGVVFLNEEICTGRAYISARGRVSQRGDLHRTCPGVSAAGWDLIPRCGVRYGQDARKLSISGIDRVAVSRREGNPQPARSHRHVPIVLLPEFPFPGYDAGLQHQSRLPGGLLQAVSTVDGALAGNLGYRHAGCAL